MDLNAEVQRQLEDLNMPGAVQFKADYNTFKCILIIKHGGQDSGKPGKPGMYLEWEIALENLECTWNLPGMLECTWN